MKKLVISLTLLAVAVMIHARETGYRGFFDVGYAISTSKVSYYDLVTTDVSDRWVFSTTHGCQASPYFFVGAGVGLTYWHETVNKSIGIPIYGDIRLDVLPSKVCCPFIDAKIGYSLNDIEGFYFHPSIGLRFGRHAGFNVGAGYQVQKVKGIDGYCGALQIKIGVDF